MDLRPEDLLHDDENLLADRLLRSLHRNSDGHLATAYNLHTRSVKSGHNVSVIYLYSVDEGAYTLHQHYLHSRESLTYKTWNALVLKECKALVRASNESFHGVYGWLTAHTQITPLRTGDVLIKIDSEGARGVRLSFSARKNDRKTLKKAK